MSADDSLPDDVITLKAMLRAERAARLAAEAEAQARTLTIEKLKLTIKKLRHEQFGQSSERGALLDQLELQLADLETHAKGALKPNELLRAFVHYKHVDYYDTTLFTRAYDWMKARGMSEGQSQHAAL